MKTAGKPTDELVTPDEMLRGVFHALLGHYNLYASGWLHQDVSSGNVILLRVAEDRVDSSTTHITWKMLWMIIDGDRDVQWNNRDREISTEPCSGTLSYLSVRLIVAWSKNAAILHTAIDNLDSFLWVLLLSVLEKGITRFSGPLGQEQYLYDMFQEIYVYCIYQAKAIFLDVIQSLLGKKSWLPALHQLHPPFVKWNDLGMHYKTKITDLEILDVISGP
ncbi:hypothetical protein BDN70DRAFT_936215 [Pholiota conissans]|uniref:Fungal-type protein kinase domain-containing protein n=1 Tax=Pholiota conissans TaxID=109636 RepID=A0A9P5YT72_9AGAR|nr:hypothetical protein BDN70DRAFT_936215 [Pholiota conissans]